MFSKRNPYLRPAFPPKLTPRGESAADASRQPDAVAAASQGVVLEQTTSTSVTGEAPIAPVGDDASHTAPASPHRSTQPQPFPLSPPTPTIELRPEPAAGEDDDQSDGSDELPTLEELAERMHPERRSQSQNFKAEPASPLAQRPVVKQEVSEGNVIYVSSREASPAPRLPASQPPPSSANRRMAKAPSATQPSPYHPPQIRPKPASSSGLDRSDLKRRLSADSSIAGNESATPKRPRKFRKHEEFWVLDGSVILQVEDYQFKLHRSSLAKQSAWMSVLFEEAPDGEDAGGMPIYCLDKTGIRVGDFEILLRIWENAIQFASEPAPFATIAAVLRASLALHFLDYEAFARRQLEKRWPAVLEDVTDTRIPDAIGTVVLTRDGKMPGIRKRAMYELVRTEGFGQSSGEDQKLTDTEHRALLRAREKTSYAWVSNACMAPKLQLSSGEGRHVYGSDRTCVARHDLFAYFEAIQENKIIERYMNDAICGFKALIDTDWEKCRFCATCANEMRAVWKDLRQKEWENLDEYFAGAP